MLRVVFLFTGLACSATEVEEASFASVKAKVKKGLEKIGTNDASRQSLMRSAMKHFDSVGTRLSPADAQALESIRGLLNDIRELTAFEVAAQNDILENMINTQSNCDALNQTDINVSITNLDVLRDAHTTCRIAHAQALQTKIHMHNNLRTWQGDTHYASDDEGNQFSLAQACVLPAADEASIISGEWTDFLEHTLIWFDTQYAPFAVQANNYIDAYTNELANTTQCNQDQLTYETEVCAAKTLYEQVCVIRDACWSVINTTEISGQINTWREDNELSPTLIQTMYYVDCLIVEMIANTSERMVNAATTCDHVLQQAVVYNNTNYSDFFINTTLLEDDSPIFDAPANCSYLQDIDLDEYMPFSGDYSQSAPQSAYYRYIVENNNAWTFGTEFVSTFFDAKISPGPQCSGS